MSATTAKQILHLRPAPALRERAVAPPHEVRRRPALGVDGFHLRPMAPADVGKLTGAAIGVPHPYLDELGRDLLAAPVGGTRAPCALYWTATRIGDARILGYAGLNAIDRARRQAELCFLSGGSNAGDHAVAWCEAVVAYAMAGLELQRVYALQLVRHPPAEDVLEGLGMQPEGFLRRRMRREGLVEDVVCWRILSQEWGARRGTTPLETSH